MPLSTITAKRCSTISAWAIDQGKILLVKHKKLGAWLAPGGHVDENELPHKAAEREFFEETGIQAEVVSAYPLLEAKESEFLPMPFGCNLHTINKPRGASFCEQHYVFAYFVKVVDLSGAGHQIEEVDEMRWFTRDEIMELEMWEDVRSETLYVFDHFPKI